LVGLNLSCRAFIYLGPEEVLKFAFFVFDKDKNGFIEKGSYGYFMYHFLVVFCSGLGLWLGVRIRVKARVRVRVRIRFRFKFRFRARVWVWVSVRFRVSVRVRVRFWVKVRARVRFITSYWYFMTYACKQRNLTN
jgi:hypothetical protein